MVVRVHGLIAGFGDRRRALPVVPFRACLGLGLHLEVRGQLVEGVDGADVEPAGARILHHVVDQSVGEELCVLTLGEAGCQGDQ